MSIEIHCQTCDKHYRVKADLAGKRVRCSNCGNPLTVPNGQANTTDAAADLYFVQDHPPENVKRPSPPKTAPPPVPKQVVRFDPRFDPQAMTDIPAPPPPATPAAPKPNPQRAPQPARKSQNDAGRELHFADEDPLSMIKPKPTIHDHLADTADGPAISEDSPEPRLDHEPLIPRGKRGSGKLADTAAAAPPSDEPDLDIPPPDEAAIF
ncbi:MAG TPA: hypothetical protein VGP94_00485, partial [Tepidisphaeraceae bacterium]|nr:hypothetical protein [Tepidisphaeraceae bacterium]